MTQLQNQTIPIEEEEINLIELWNTLWKRRKFLGFFVSFITCIVAGISFILPNIYRSEVTILPTSQHRLGSLSAFSSLAGIAGISPPVSFEAAEIKARLRSKMIYARLIEKYNLLPILFSEEWDKSKKQWKDPEDHPTVDDGIRLFKKSLVHISEDRKTQAITIAVEFRDPKIAAYLAGILVKELKDIMVKDTVERAKKSLEELEKTLPKVTDPLVQQKIYALMAKHIETISLAKATKSFAFKVIDPPRVPDRKYKPKRRLMVILAFISSLFLGIFLVFFKEYLDNLKKKEKLT